MAYILRPLRRAYLLSLAVNVGLLAVAAISSRQWGDDMAKSGNCWGDACICVPPTKIFGGTRPPRSLYNRRPCLLALSLVSRSEAYYNKLKLYTSSFKRNKRIG